MGVARRAAEDGAMRRRTAALALAAAGVAALAGADVDAQSLPWRNVLPALPVPSAPAAVPAPPSVGSVQTVARVDLGCAEPFVPTTPLDAGLALGGGAAGGAVSQAMRASGLGALTGLIPGGGHGTTTNDVKQVLLRSVWLPADFEEALGARLAADLPTSSVEEAAGRRNGERYRQVATLFDRLVAALPPDQPYRFRLAFGDEPGENAAALPGGLVIVQPALVRRPPELVVGVLAHEIAHVLRRHQTRHWQSLLADTVDVGTLVRLSLGGRGEFDRAIGAVTQGDQAGRRFARFHADQELEADACTPRLAKAAGFDPVAVADAFARWTVDASAGDAAQRGPFDLRHPPSTERASVLAAAAQRWAGADATITRSGAGAGR